jgi:hypothetical protein
MIFKNFFARLAGKKAAKSLKLKEGPVTNTKQWYRSRNVWTGIITVLIGLYSGIQSSVGPEVGWSLPAIPEWIFAFLGALGIYTRVTASKTISK